MERLVYVGIKITVPYLGCLGVGMFVFVLIIVVPRDIIVPVS